MRVHVTIVAHGEPTALATFKRHIPYWRHHPDSVVEVLCPIDQPIPEDQSPWPVHKQFLSQHHGWESWLRLRWLFNYLKDQKGFSHFLVHEYDSICLDPSLPELTGFFGNVWPCTEPERFIATRYSNQPYLIDAASLLRMAYESARWPQVFEEGHADRYFAALATLARVPILPYVPKGFTNDTIHAGQYNDLHRSIMAGATMIHGVKNKETLDVIENARKEYLGK